MDNTILALHENLIHTHVVGKRRNDFWRHKVERESERDGEGQGRQRSPTDGQKHKRETEANEDGHKAGDCRVPVAVRRRFANKDGVEDKIAKAEFDALILILFFQGDLWKG